MVEIPSVEEVEAARPEYEEAAWHLTQTQRPDWKVGEGANNEEWKQHNTVELDPNDPKRVITPFSMNTNLIAGSY